MRSFDIEERETLTGARTRTPTAPSAPLTAAIVYRFGMVEDGEG